MKKVPYYRFIPIYSLLLTGFLAVSFSLNQAVAVLSEMPQRQERVCIIIDAGHGGEDGGAVSCSGVPEKQYNLSIALRLNDLMHLFGLKTYMIRSDDRSVYREGNSLSQKKISDLRERVRIVNALDPSILVSIHQNYFPESRYHGAQVFYRESADSKRIADDLQAAFTGLINRGSNRKSKKAENIYLMEHIQQPGVLIECGFLSNPEEDAMLKNKEYQNKICSIISCCISNYISSSAFA